MGFGPFNQKEEKAENGFRMTLTVQSSKFLIRTPVIVKAPCLPSRVNHNNGADKKTRFPGVSYRDPLPRVEVGDQGKGELPVKAYRPFVSKGWRELLARIGEECTDLSLCVCVM